MLLALENQTYIDYLAPYRDCALNIASLSEEIRKRKKEHLDAHDLHNPNEFLTGVSKEDRFTPTFMLTVYAGKGPWDAPKDLTDLLDIPQNIRPFWHKSWPTTVVEARTAHLNFRSDENRLLFEIIQANADPNAKTRERKEKVLELCEPFARDKDMLDIASGVLKWEGLPEAIRRLSGGEDMNLVLDDWQEELKAEGEVAGSVKSVIAMARDLNDSDEFIIAQLMKYVPMDHAQAEEALKRSRQLPGNATAWI